MRTYGQYCPIARASELLAERWSFIILRNIVLIGCRTFNEIADGAPGLSRGLLSKRLRDLERAGVVEIRSKPDGPGSTYEPTQAGRELSEVMLALQRWGAQWAELTPEHAHPGVVLWGWVSCHLDRGRLPRRRVLVRFEYPTLSGPGSRGWLLIERGDAEICEKHPGGDEDLVSWSAIRWHSPAGISESWSGATPCAAGRSRFGAHARWRVRFPLGSAASTRSGARLPRGKQPPPPKATGSAGQHHRPDPGSDIALLVCPLGDDY